MLSFQEIPKRPATPFLQFFHSENNRSLNYRYPNIIDRSKIAGEMWRNLSTIEKDRYKSAYQKELDQFYENLTDEKGNLCNRNDSH